MPDYMLDSMGRCLGHLAGRWFGAFIIQGFMWCGFWLVVPWVV
jgi:hypothetical protein